MSQRPRPAMPTPLELDNNNNNHGDASTIDINISGLLDAVGDDPGSSKQLARLLFLLGFFTLLMDLATALYKPPRGVVFEQHKLAYYLTLAGIFAAGLAEISTAFWVSRSSQLNVDDGHRRRAFARAVLCASVGPLVAIIALGGFSVLVKG